MNVRVFSAALHGIDGTLVDVEVDMVPGVGRFDIVGLPEAAVKESKVRVLSTLRALGYRASSRWITVNLAPADVRKRGSLYDLPIALGVLACLNAFPSKALEDRMFLGELSLDGRIRPVPGVLPMVAATRELGITEAIVPTENGAEAAVVKGVRCFAADTLAGLVHCLSSDDALPRVQSAQATIRQPSGLDYADVRGQAHAKRALEIAAAGRHNLLMMGPPGSGKTMLARRLPTILPWMTYEESLETTKIYSVAGMLRQRTGLMTRRPFRAPHHTGSAAAVAGGGSIPRPGEVSMAHNGLMFIDELPEWQRGVLEVLRQPMEDRSITITRTAGSFTYPSDFLLIAAMNPCPCGYWGDPRHRCSCSSADVARYRGRVSGPLMDRIDLHVEVPAVPFRDLTRPYAATESSAAIRERVQVAVDRQAARFEGSDVRFNGRMGTRQVKEHCVVPKESIRLLETAMDRLGLSARALDRILKVSRTIADLEGSDNIRSVHVSEAIQYRLLDRGA
ncbi:MAG: YifB family Mg chelatase-like AAA ATPase [Deltaproteobacteria bacterium]|nr:YifB family Mg chelatase-like AAA ATPase [Deltaproteobacteria bacterium]